jgi:hypothetical protein
MIEAKQTKLRRHAQADSIVNYGHPITITTDNHGKKWRDVTHKPSPIVTAEITETPVETSL